MLGRGVIFERYRDGVYEDDDEVAVANADAESGYRCGSAAMVNIRHGLEQAQRLEFISAATARALETLAKQQFYPDRHWGTLLTAGGREGLAPAELAALAAYVRDTQPDLKRDDTVTTLRGCSPPSRCRHRIHRRSSSNQPSPGNACDGWNRQTNGTQCRE